MEAVAGADWVGVDASDVDGAEVEGKGAEVSGTKGAEVSGAEGAEVSGIEGVEVSGIEGAEVSGTEGAEGIEVNVDAGELTSLHPPLSRPPHPLYPPHPPLLSVSVSIVGAAAVEEGGYPVTVTVTVNNSK